MIADFQPLSAEMEGMMPGQVIFVLVFDPLMLVTHFSIGFIC